jgi:hypothetical protein
MRMWAKGTARATLLTASFVALGAGPALADVTSGHGSVLGGNQIQAPVSAPIDVSGNAVAVVGRALAGSAGGASVRNNGGGGGQYTSGRHSVGGGNQVNAPVNVPVNACGNAVAVIGRALAGCEGGAQVHGGGGYGGQRTSGRHSVLGGNQVNAPISAPINICGNAAALLGDAAAGCEGGSKVTGGGHHGYGAGYGDGGYDDGGYGGRHSSGKHSVLGGNQIHAPVNAPVNICGNAVGNAVAGCEGGAQVHGGGGYGGQRTSGRGSVLGGNQVDAPVSVPVNICGNAVAVLGDATAGCAGLLPHGGTHASGGRTSGRHSVGGGNQVTAPVNAPVDVCGNAAAVVGQAYGSCGGDECISPSSAPASHRLGELPGLPLMASRDGAAPMSTGALPADLQLPVDPQLPIDPQLPVHPRSLALPQPLDRRSAPASLGLPGQTLIAPMSAPAGGRPVPGLADVPDLLPGALPAAADLSGRRMASQSSDESLPGLPALPITLPGSEAGAMRPVHDAPPVGGPPKRLPPFPPFQATAAESQPGVQGGALVALVIGGLLVASSVVVARVSRLRRR